MGNDERALILVADQPQNAQHIKRILSETDDLVLVHHMTAAVRLIENVDFDAIIAGIHFDDSRMIDLLRVVRKAARHVGKPFVAIRLEPTSLTPEMETKAKQMAAVLGASGYITIDDLAGEEQPDDCLRDKLRALIKQPVPKSSS